MDDSINVVTEQLNRALRTNKQTILIDDMNVDNLENNYNAKLEEFFTTYGMVRMTPNKSQNFNIHRLDLQT